MKEDRNGRFILLDENPNKYGFQGKVVKSENLKYN